MTTPMPASPARPAAPRRRGTPARRRTWPTAQPDLVLLTVLASVVVVVSLWLANGNLQQLTTGHGLGLTSGGRLTGLIASDLLLLQVLAMARIPWVEQAFGQDRLARWHRWLGFSSFWLMVTHIVLITMGYATTARRSVLPELWHLVLTYPGMLLAAASTVLLVMVVVTSIKAARRKLRYESWHLLHLYAYLGVGLALPHQVWTGADFIASPWSKTYWWTLYAGSLGAVLCYRVGLPLVRTLRHRVVVHHVVREAEGIVSVHLRGRALDKLPAKPGQFFVWRFLDGPGWSRGHPYSLSAKPHKTMLRITVKDLGDGSRVLADVRPGTRVLLEGPYGALTVDRRTRTRTTLIACGIGITPLRALLEDLPSGTNLIYRARDESEVVLRNELTALAEARRATISYLIGPRAGDGSWIPAEWRHVGEVGTLRHLVPGIRDQDVYVCGPEAWMDAMLATLRDAAVPDSQVHVERFAY